MSLDIRPYENADESGVLALLRAALGDGPTGERSPSFFRWKHLESPFGPSYMLLATSGGEVIGLRAFLRWTLRSQDSRIRAVRAVDTATHPAHQGKGIFRELTTVALQELKSEADLVFNTPNEKSGPGYLKMGWKDVGRLPIGVHIRRPLRFARNIGSTRGGGSGVAASAPGGSSAADVLAAATTLEGLSGATKSAGRWYTPRVPAFLQWRYSSAPLGYRATALGTASSPDGIAIYRVRSRGRLVEATVAELLVREGDLAASRSLLRQLIRDSEADHVTIHFAKGSDQLRAARRLGFWRAPGGMRLVVNPLREGLLPDPRDAGAWALSLGDLEVF